MADGSANSLAIQRSLATAIGQLCVVRAQRAMPGLGCWTQKNTFERGAHHPKR
jgi:hypothetical protein